MTLAPRELIDTSTVEVSKTLSSPKGHKKPRSIGLFSKQRILVSSSWAVSGRETLCQWRRKSWSPSETDSTTGYGAGSGPKLEPTEGL